MVLCKVAHRHPDFGGTYPAREISTVRVHKDVRVNWSSGHRLNVHCEHLMSRSWDARRTAASNVSKGASYSMVSSRLPIYRTGITSINGPVSPAVGPSRNRASVAWCCTTALWTTLNSYKKSRRGNGVKRPVDLIKLSIQRSADCYIRTVNRMPPR